jgi:peptide/nickel transport system substrate-binding protein/oligopeptide transport system substrate-binding protein
MEVCAKKQRMGVCSLYKSRSRHQRRVIVCGLAVLLASLCWFGSGVYQTVRTAGIEGEHMRLGVIGPLENLQPATIADGRERLVGSAMYEGLTAHDADTGELQPRLSSGWEFTDEGYSLIFTIRPQVTLHNGALLTPELIKQSWEYNLQRGDQSRAQALIEDVAGAQAFFNGQTSHISGIETGKNQLILRFIRPNTAFPAIATNPLFWISSPGPAGEMPAGTGPYRLQSREEKIVVLTAFYDYHRGLPRIGRITAVSYPDPATGWQAYQDGRLDYLDRLPAAAVDTLLGDPQRRSQLRQQPMLEYYGYAFHLQRQPYIGRTDLRRALNYAVDRPAIIQALLGHEFIPAQSVIPQGAGLDSAIRLGYQHDADMAAQLLEQAGYANRADTGPLVLTYNAGNGHRGIAGAVAEQLDELGVSLELVEVDWEYYQKQLPRMPYSFFRVGWAADYADADDFLVHLYHSRNIGLTNYNGYENAQVDHLLDQSRRETDPAQRLQYLQRAEDVILDDAPYLWLFQRQGNQALQPEVRRFTMNGMAVADWFEVSL